MNTTKVFVTFESPGTFTRVDITDKNLYIKRTGSTVYENIPVNELLGNLSQRELSNLELEKYPVIQRQKNEILNYREKIKHQNIRENIYVAIVIIQTVLLCLRLLRVL